MIRSRKISFLIGAIHLFFVGILIFHPKFSAKQNKPHRLRVQIAQQSLPVRSTAGASAPTVKKVAANSVPKKKPILKPQPTKPETKKKSSAPQTPKPEAKKNIPTAQSVPKKKESAARVSKKLIAELEESIAKIDEKQDKLKAESKIAPANSRALSDLAPLSSLNSVESSVSSLRGEIKELLVHELRSFLNLPDFGEVKVCLYFGKDGCITEVKILKADSKKNRDYLEKQLLNRYFSLVSNLDLSEKDRSFVITFCNEI